MARTIQPSFAAGELAPSLHARVDLAKYHVGLATALNVFIHAHGGASNRPGTKFIAEVKDSAKAVRLIPFEFSTVQTYMLEFGEQYMRVHKDGGQVVEAAVAVTGATQANPVTITTGTAHGYAAGDEVYVSGVGGMTELNGRNFVVTSTPTTTTFTIEDKAGTPVDGTAYGTYTSGGEAERVYEIATPYAAADVGRLAFAQSADVMYLVHPDYAPRKLSRTGHTAWTLAAVTFTPGIAAPTGEAASYTGAKTAATLEYKVTAVDDETGEESLPSGIASVTGPAEYDWPAGDKVSVSWTAVSGAGRYRVYKADNGIYGYIGTTEATSFDDDNIGADVSDAPPSARNPFSGAGNYPSAVMFHEQRLAFADTTNNPQTLWLSRLSAYENFSVSSPTKADDAITVTIAARQVNELRHMVSLDNLVLLTSGGEWRLRPGGSDAALSPSSVQVKPQSYRGAAWVSPIVIGNTVLFVQEKGAITRDLSYSFEVDGYTGNDLSVLANHLFEGYQINDWAYAQAPHSLVWAVRDDGKMMSLTYMREHEVFAWAQHETAGTYEAVATVSEGQEDATYVVVKRTLQGRTVRCIERFASRTVNAAEDSYFVDCGLAYDGAATSAVGGLWHLEGEEVVILADGNVMPKQTVTNGKVSLSIEATKANVGLAYTSRLKTLPLDLNTGSGTVQGRKKAVTALTLRVDRSRGIWAGPDEASMREYKQRKTEAWGEAIQLYTGDIHISMTPKWTDLGQIVIEQRDPLPMSILAVIPEVSIGN